MTRLTSVDNLRVLLTVLVVLHHAALTYGHIPAWYWHEPAADPSGYLLDVLVLFNQAFFMGLFFFLSGLFTPASHDRKGSRAFLRDRLLRLGVPLLAYLLVLRPLVTWPHYDGERPYWQYYLLTWDPGPMWFVEVLLVFSALYVLLRRWARPLPPPGLRGVALFVAALGMASFLWRLVVPIGTTVPVLGLPTPAYLPQYAAFFAAGVLAHRGGWFAALTARAGRLGLITALAAAPLMGVLAAMVAPGPLQSLAFALTESAFAVGVSVWLAVFFRDRVSGARPWWSDQAYAVYLVHPLVLVWVAVALQGWQAPAVARFAVLAAIALPVCWGLAWLVRSIPGAGRIL